MEPLGWYSRRLRTMSPREVLWRVGAGVRDRADRLLLGSRQRGRSLGEVLSGGNGRARPGFRVCDVEAAECVSRWGGDGGRWVDRLLGQADRVAAGRLSYFDLVDCDLGSPIDWHRDHRAQVAAPRRFAAAIDYRDFGQTGDCKQVWEPNRHHQLVVLGRAHRATGGQRLARPLDSLLCAVWDNAA